MQVAADSADGTRRRSLPPPRHFKLKALVMLGMGAHSGLMHSECRVLCTAAAE